jgi:hypothetical protein
MVMSYPSRLSIETYNREVDEYVNGPYRAYMEEVCLAEEQAGRSFNLVVKVTNEGTASAEHVVAELFIPEEFTVRDPEDAPDLPDVPAPPKRPRSALEESAWSIELPDLSTLSSSYFPQLSGLHINEGWELVEGTVGIGSRGYHKLTYSFDMVMHNVPFETPAFVLVIPSAWYGNGIEMAIALHAANQRHPSRHKLAIAFTDSTQDSRLLDN